MHLSHAPACDLDLLERAISGIYKSSSSSRDEKCCVWAEFETCLNSDFDSDFNTALHEAILKSCKYFLNTVETFMFLFYFEQFHSMNITIPMYHFRVAEIHFYI